MTSEEEADLRARIAKDILDEFPQFPASAKAASEVVLYGRYKDRKKEGK